MFVFPVRKSQACVQDCWWRYEFHLSALQPKGYMKRSHLNLCETPGASNMFFSKGVARSSKQVPPLGCGISEDQPLPMMRQLELWVQVPSWSLKQSNRQTGVYKHTAPQNQIQTHISCSIIFRIALMFELFWVYLGFRVYAQLVWGLPTVGLGSFRFFLVVSLELAQPPC